MEGRGIVYSVTVLAALALAFSPLFTNEPPWRFIFEVDDYQNIVLNEFIRKLSMENMKEMCTARIFMVYEPLGFLLKALIYAIGGLDERLFRQITLLLHACNTFLLFRFILWLLPRMHHRQPAADVTIPALIGALAFAVHPITAEVIGWPSAQPFSLSCLFTLLCFHAYARHLHRCSSSWYYLANLCYICAVLSKGAAVTVPVGILCIDMVCVPPSLLRPSLPALHRLVRYCRKRMSFAVFVVCFVGLTLWGNEGGEVRHLVVISGPQQRLIKVMCTLLSSLRLLLWPTSLRLYYMVQERTIDTQVWSNEFLLSALVLWGIISYALVRAWGGDASLFSLCFFYVGVMVPVVGLVDHGRVFQTADRYLYLPMIGFSVAIAHVCATLPTTTEKVHSPPRIRKWGRGFWTVLVVVMWVVLTNKQMRNWRDEMTLFEYMTREDPTNYVVLEAMHRIYLRYGHDDKAERMLLEEAYVHMPRKGVQARMFRACTGYGLRGDLQEVCVEFDELFQEVNMAYKGDEEEMLKNNLAVCMLLGGGSTADADALLREAHSSASPRVKGSIEMNREAWTKNEEVNFICH